MRKNLLLVGALVAALAFGGTLLILLQRRGHVPAPAATAAAASAATPGAPQDTRKIRATLFYVSSDGERLVPREREVPFGEGTVAQARRIVEAQVAPPPPGLVSAVPAGTTLRALYVTDRGDAFVDLSREVSSAHPGGSLNELLTVYSIVGALTANLPAVKAVQILVDGHEVDTLAGHVDLRRPLTKNTGWMEMPPSPPADPVTGAARSSGGALDPGK